MKKEKSPNRIVQEDGQESNILKPLFVKEKPEKELPGMVALSDKDSRQIRTLMLGNKMKAVLIHDPLAEKSAASIDVGIGSLHNPKELNGLTTFLQHMLLCGSKKYPDQKKCDDFLTKFGGKFNSFTGLDNTNYTLEIDHKGFDEGCDRLAQYFVNPLFNEDNKAKTIKLLHHQMKSALVNDEWKHLNLWMQLSNPESVTNRFVFPSKEIFEKGPAMKIVKEFFDQWYSANLMTVCISSNKSLVELEKIAKKFKDIKNRKIAVPDISNPAPYGAKESKKFIKMQCSSENLEMRIVWSLPYYGDKIAKMNLKYFMELFGHQGPKSIISYLKKEGLATSLEVRKKSIGTMTKFEVVIGLTQAGHDNNHQVAEAVF